MKHYVYYILLFIILSSFWAPVSANPQDNLNCTLLGEWPYGLCEAVYATGDTLFMANGRTLQIYEISDVQNPVLISEVVTKGIINAIQVQDQTAFIGNYKEGLIIIDVSDPVNPTEISRYPGNDETYEVQDLCVKDNVVFLITNDITALDISNKSEPTLISVLDAHYCQDFHIAGDYCFTTGYNDGTTIYNIADPANMFEVINIPLDGKNNAVDVKDNFLYTGCGGNVFVYDITDIENPVIIDTMYTGSVVHEMFIHDNFISIVASSNGLDIWDISDPHNCEMVNYYYTPDNTFFVTATSEKVIIADNGGDVYLFEFDPDAEMGSMTPSIIEPGGRLQEIEIEGNYAYIANSHHGLRIIDITNPSDPQLLSTWRQDHCYATDLEVKNDTVYIAMSYAGLYILNTSNKQNPQVIGKLDSSYSCEYLHVENDKIIVATNDRYIRIIDISDPTSLVEISSFSTNNSIDGFEYSVPYLATLEGSNGLYLFDLSDYLNPVKVDSFTTPNRISALTFFENYIITYDYSRYVRYIDITNPAAITESHAVSYRNYIFEMEILNNSLYTASTSIALNIFDLNDSNNLESTGSFDNNDEARKLAIQDDLIGILNRETGLWFIKYDPTTAISENPSEPVPMEFLLKQNYPNPFNPETVIEYDLLQKQFISISLYNTNGQLVQKLYSGVQSTGNHKLTINAKNLPSGVYFYKLETENATDIKKCLLLK